MINFVESFETIKNGNMKKLKSSLLALSLAATLSTLANPIDKTMARVVAQEFVGIDDATSDDVPLAAYYVFSRGEGRGYVIVSGDDATAPIIGYTDEGDFRYESLPTPLQGMLKKWQTLWLERNADAETATVDDGAANVEGTRRMARARLGMARRGVDAFKAGWKDVSPLVQTHWNQGYPYNIFSPKRADNGQKTLTGCEATAAAQVVYYFRRDNPEALLYSTPTYSEGWFNAPVTYSLPAGTPVRYDLMRLSGSGTAAQDSAVAVLMYALGTCAHLGYGYQDGTATAGDTDKMGAAMDSQFNLKNNYEGKWNYSQSGWESLIYNNLTSGRPMLYSGANDGGGHAVVLDGYQASTGLYHFNFGWGGDGDGWFTVDDETGMNGYNSGQAMLSQVTPKKANLKGLLNRPENLFAKVDNKISATIRNNGTLTCRTLNAYCGTSSKVTSNTKLEPLSTVNIPSGKSAEIEWSYSPVRQGTIYVFLCDDNMNLLDSMKVSAVATIADLHLNSLKAEASSEVETLDEMAFSVVNNTEVNVVADLENREHGSLCQPIMQCRLTVYDPDTKTWTAAGVKVVNDVTFQVGERKAVTFTFNNLDAGSFYKAEMNKSVRAGQSSEMVYESTDTIALFKVVAPDLDVAIDGRRAVVTGSWNKDVFEQKRGGAEVCVYDMTAVKGVTGQPVAENGNALFLLSEPVAGTANTIVEGVCDSLVLMSDQEFMPAEAFTARRASFTVERAKVGEWVDVVVPFAATAPQGMLLRAMTGLEGSAITVEQKRQVDGMSMVLCMTDHPSHNVFTGNDVTIAATTDAMVADGQLVGSTLAGEVGDGMMAFTMYNNRPYYRPTDAGTPLLPFATMMTITRRSGVRVFDQALGDDRDYASLAETISEAYDLAEADAGAEGVELLLEAIARAEEAFSTATAATAGQLSGEQKALAQAMADFASGAAAGIAPVRMDEGESGQTEYYNINGQRLERPESGIVIVRRGGSVRKIVVR